MKKTYLVKTYSCTGHLNKFLYKNKLIDKQ